MHHDLRRTGTLAAAILSGMAYTALAQEGVPGEAPAQALPPPAPAASLEANPDRIQPRGTALNHSTGVRDSGFKAVARTALDGPDRLATVDFEGRIVMFTSDGVSFRRIKLEGSNGVGVRFEDLKCIAFNGAPHWLAVTNRLMSGRIVVGLYAMDGKLVAKYEPPNKPKAHVTIRVDFADVTGDKRPEIIGTLGKSTPTGPDGEDSSYSSYLFVLNDKCELLAQKQLALKFPGALHVCIPEREGETPLILLEGDSSVQKFVFRQLEAPAVPPIIGAPPAAAVPNPSPAPAPAPAEKPTP